MILSERSRALVFGALVVGSALILRLAMMSSTRFTGEEAYFYSVARGIAELKSFPLLGPSMTSGRAMHPGPGFFYLMSIPHNFVSAPEAANAWVEILGAVSVGLIWHALRRPFGEIGAFTAGIALAFAPWSALYADRIWNSNVVGFPIAIAFLAAIRVHENPSSKWIAALIAAASITPQFHMSAPVVLIGLFVLVRKGWRQWNRRAILVGLAIAALFYVPLAIHEIQTGFGNTRAFFDETFRTGNQRSWTFLLVPLYLARFVSFDVSFHTLTGYWGGLDEFGALRSLWSGTADRPMTMFRFLAFAFSLLFAGAAVFSCFVELRRRAKSGKEKLGPFAVASLVAIGADFVLCGVTGKQFFPPYAQALLPFLFIAFAMLGRELASRPKLLFGLLAIWAIGGAEATLSTSYSVDARNGLATKRGILEKIATDARAKGIDPSSPVNLGSTYDYHQYSIQVLSDQAYRRPLNLTNQRVDLRYRLQKPAELPPPDRIPDQEISLSAAVLYPLR